MKLNLFYFLLFNIVLGLFLLQCATPQKVSSMEDTKINVEASKADVKKSSSSSKLFFLFCQAEDNQLCQQIFLAVNRQRKIPLQSSATNFDFRLQILQSHYGYVLRLYQNEKLIQTAATRSYHEIVLLGKAMIDDFVPSSTTDQQRWESF